MATARGELNAETSEAKAVQPAVSISSGSGLAPATPSQYDFLLKSFDQILDAFDGFPETLVLPEGTASSPQDDLSEYHAKLPEQKKAKENKQVINPNVELIKRWITIFNMSFLSDPDNDVLFGNRLDPAKETARIADEKLMLNIARANEIELKSQENFILPRFKAFKTVFDFINLIQSSYALVREKYKLEKDIKKIIKFVLEAAKEQGLIKDETQLSDDLTSIFFQDIRNSEDFDTIFQERCEYIKQNKKRRMLPADIGKIIEAVLKTAKIKGITKESNLAVSETVSLFKSDRNLQDLQTNDTEQLEQFAAEEPITFSIHFLPDDPDKLQRILKIVNNLEFLLEASLYGESLRNGSHLALTLNQFKVLINYKLSNPDSNTDTNKVFEELKKEPSQAHFTAPELKPIDNDTAQLVRANELYQSFTTQIKESIARYLKFLGEEQLNLGDEKAHTSDYEINLNKKIQDLKERFQINNTDDVKRLSDCIQQTIILSRIEDHCTLGIKHLEAEIKKLTNSGDNPHFAIVYDKKSNQIINFNIPPQNHDKIKLLLDKHKIAFQLQKEAKNAQNHIKTQFQIISQNKMLALEKSSFFLTLLLLDHKIELRFSEYQKGIAELKQKLEIQSPDSDRYINSRLRENIKKLRDTSPTTNAAEENNLVLCINYTIAFDGVIESCTAYKDYLKQEIKKLIGQDPVIHYVTELRVEFDAKPCNPINLSKLNLLLDQFAKAAHLESKALQSQMQIIDSADKGFQEAKNRTMVQESLDACLALYKDYRPSFQNTTENDNSKSFCTAVEKSLSQLSFTRKPKSATAEIASAAGTGLGFSGILLAAGALALALTTPINPLGFLGIAALAGGSATLAAGSAGAEKGRWKSLSGYFGLSAAGGGIMTGLATAGFVNIWNPIGWMILGSCALVAATGCAYKAYKDYKAQQNFKARQAVNVVTIVPPTANDSKKAAESKGGASQSYRRISDAGITIARTASSESPQAPQTPSTTPQSEMLASSIPTPTPQTPSP